MTDPMTVAIATAMAGKTVEMAGEPIRAAVGELVDKVRKRIARRPERLEAELARAAASDPTPERIAALAAALRLLMDDDPQWAAELTPVWTQAQMHAAAHDDGVVNVVNGGAGRVVQLRDVQGDLTIG